MNRLWPALAGSVPSVRFGGPSRQPDRELAVHAVAPDPALPRSPRPVHRRPVILAAVALLALVAMPLRAQIVGTDSALVPGQRTRLSYERLRRPLIGEFVSADTGEIILRKAGGSGLYYVKWDDVARLETSVSQRSRRETIVRGVLMGYAIGVALGGGVLVLADMFGFDESCCLMRDARTVATRGTVLSTVGGGFIGLWWPPDTWRLVPLRERPPRLTMLPLRHEQVGIGFALGTP